MDLYKSNGEYLDPAISCPIKCSDCGMSTEPVSKIKSAMSVGEVKTILFQRWSGTTFEQGQLRIMCDNQYDAAKERRRG